MEGESIRCVYIVIGALGSIPEDLSSYLNQMTHLQI